MMKKTNFKGIRGLQVVKAAPFALLFLYGNQALAQSSTRSGGSNVSALEILGYVGMIAALVLVTWIFGSWQSKHTAHHAPPKNQKHFEHPNDPHFKKLKKKTS